MALPRLREELDLLPGPLLGDGQPSWTLHDPVRWKYHAVGAWHLNGTLPARHSWI